MPNWSPTPAASTLSVIVARPDPRLEALLRRWLVLGLLAVAVVPALRGSSAWLGWWPMWLVAMPAAAWWALRRFPLPAGWRTPGAVARRRRRGQQARRRTGSPAAVVRRQVA